MNTAHQREQAIFERAIELPPEERSAYLDQATQGDAVLRQRLESLLAAHAAGDFLEKAPTSPDSRRTVVLSLAPNEKSGDRIGRYKLLQQIGEGGCGVVYMAEQEEPVRRRVARKNIKLGMDTKSVIARFEAERQALALMDHPNIAKVFDAGATDTGRPYFVMELVRGMKITEYCDEARLGLRERLELFMQVCGAVQHAHQKGIIHRDLKPSNILVTVNDGVAVPKVIDFGIAKATGGQELTEKTLFTAFDQFIGTPAYMSPEQTVITSLDVDTRSDIYALGVLLYELLTGKTPFDMHELLAIGLDEMRRTIREKEPARPSTRLSTMAGNDLGTTAQRRSLAAPKLVTELRGDLDWIVMKCLEKDRARRYETAAGLARDIQRHLHDEPVTARPPSSFYRLQKFVRRNKRATIVSATVAVTIAIALVLGAGLLSKERQNRTLRQNQARLEQESALSQLVKKVYYLHAQWRDDEAMKAAHEAVALQRKSHGDDDPQLAGMLDSLAYLFMYEHGRFEEVEPMLREALAIRRKHVGNDNLDTVITLCHLAVLHYNHGDLDQAEALWREGLMIQVKLWPNDPHEWSYTLFNVPNVLRDERKFDQIEQLLTKLLAQTDSSPIGDSRRAALLSLRGYYRGETGRWPEAAADLRRAVEVNPREKENWVYLALALAQAGSRTEYQKLCRDMLLRFADSADAEVTVDVAAACCLLPNTLDTNELGVADRLAKRQAANTDSPAAAGFLAQGLVKYREGDFNGTVEAMEQIQTNTDEMHSGAWRSSFEAVAYLLTGMASQQMNQAVRARESVARGLEIIQTKLPALKGGDLTVSWPAVVSTYVLANEARGLVGGRFANPDQSAYLCVDKGAQQLDQGNDYAALVWFTEALRFDEDDPEAANLDRLRIGMVLQQCPKLRALFIHGQNVWSVQFSPDGRRLLTAGEDRTARVWDAATGLPVTPPMKHGDLILGACFSPNGQRVLTASFDNTARVWDATTGTPLTPPMRHGSNVTSAVFSPDGSRVATASEDHTARVWDSMTGQPVTAPLQHGDAVWPVSFSADGRLVLTASQDKTARIWNASTGQPAMPPLQHPAAVEWAAFSPDGKWVATACADHTARIWDARTGAAVFPPLKHPEVVTYVDFSPDSKRIVTACGEFIGDPESQHRPGEARVWDVATGKPLTPPMPHSLSVYYAGFSPDGRYVATASEDKTARVWDSKTGEPVTPPFVHQDVVFRAAFSPDGALVAGRGYGDSFRIWNARTGAPTTPILMRETNVNDVTFSPDSRLVAAAAGNGIARVWDAYTGSPVSPPLRHGGEVKWIAFSPDGRRVVTASDDKTARIWNVQTGQPLTAPLQHASNVLCAAFSPDGSAVVTASEDKTARIWDASTGKAVTPPLPHNDGVHLAVFSPDGCRVATGDWSGDARIWDAKTGAPITPFMKQAGRYYLSGIESMVFSPDGNRLLIADSNDSAARIWNANTGAPATPPLKHSDAVLFATFSHDGRYVVTASFDQTARAWDATTGQPMTAYLQSKGALWCAMFTSDDQTIKTVGDIQGGGFINQGFVQSWPLISDRRPTPDLLLEAQLLSLHHLDAVGGYVPLELGGMTNRSWVLDHY